MADKFDNPYFKKQLENHKKYISKLQYVELEGTTFPEKDLWILKKIHTTAKELCLFYADFKCENPKCRAEENLTIHHAVSKRWKHFFYDHLKFMVSRFYWTNKLILCIACHRIVDADVPEKHDTPINPKLIESIKKRFENEN